MSYHTAQAVYNSGQNNGTRSISVPGYLAVSAGKIKHSAALCGDSHMTVT